MVCLEACAYCNMGIRKKHEHDHFPAPASVNPDGPTLCVCRPCHDLKDRYNLADWDPAEQLRLMSNLWEKAEPRERIILGKMFRAVNESLALMGK